MASQFFNTITTQNGQTHFKKRVAFASVVCLASVTMQSAEVYLEPYQTSKT